MRTLCLLLVDTLTIAEQDLCTVVLVLRLCAVRKWLAILDNGQLLLSYAIKLK